MGDFKVLKSVADRISNQKTKNDIKNLNTTNKLGLFDKYGTLHPKMTFFAGVYKILTQINHMLGY